MATGHAHGAFGAILLDNRNLTPHTNEMSFTPSVDVAEDTSLRPQSDGKTFLQGLRGSAASSSGYAINDYALMVKEMAHLTGSKRDLELLTQAPFGLDPGRFVVMARSRKTSFNVPVSNSSTITTSISYQCDSAWWYGNSLFNPFGAASYSGNEVQVISFDNANINQFFALRFTGTTQTFAFQAGVTNAALQSGINGLLTAIPTLAGVSATITGSLTGTDTKTGTRTITYSGTANVPQLEAITGVVRRFVVAGGDGGNYSVDGGANFLLGITEGTLQTNQRAINAAHAGVVVKGSSAAPSTGTDLTTGGVAFGEMHDGANPERVFDGSTGAAIDQGQGFGYEFATPQTITSARINFIDTGLYPATSFQLQVSNSGAFEGEETTVFTQTTTPNGGAPGWATFNFSPVTTKYFRYLNTGGYIHSIAEVQVNGGSTPGVADFISYFPVGVTPTSPTKTGTGATNATLYAAGDPAAPIVVSTLTDGGGSPSIWNLQSAVGSGDVHDGGASSSTGFYARLQVPFAVGTGLVVIVEHSDAASSGYSMLCTFTNVANPTDEALLSQEYIAPASTLVKRYVRARIASINGNYALFVGYGRV